MKKLILGENYTDDETENSSEETPEGKNDWSYFEDQLHEYVGSCQEISLEKVGMWMVCTLLQQLSLFFHMSI